MIFVYGFGPYDEFKGNVSASVIARLPKAIRDRSRVFRTIFDRAMFESALNEFQPTHILGLGQLRNGSKLRVEQYAQNLWAKRKGIPAPIVTPCCNSRREMRWSLPLNDSCEYGQDAGTYVCNYSMWVCDEWAGAHGAESAFLHIPVSFDVAAATRYVMEVFSSVAGVENN